MLPSRRSSGSSKALSFSPSEIRTNSRRLKSDSTPSFFSLFSLPLFIFVYRHAVINVADVKDNFKGRLQELCHRRGWGTPRTSSYVTIYISFCHNVTKSKSNNLFLEYMCESEGPQHSLRFYGVCFVDRDRFTTHPEFFSNRKGIPSLFSSFFI